MKARLITLLLVCTFFKAIGQISGKVLSTQGEPLPYANVVLFNGADSSIVTGTATDEQGLFVIVAPKTGTFFIQISSIAYQTHQIDTFKINNLNSPFPIPEIRLLEERNLLNEMVISARKDWMQHTPLGTTINVQSSLMSKGSNTLQVLERLPGVILDRRNNQFSLNGQGGVTILFNGRRVPLSMEELMTLLESTLADNIEKIELITSPTAQYDADGGAGIINIVFKKSEEEGTRVNLSGTVGYGYREKAATSIGISKGSKKLNWNASYAFLHDVARSGFRGNGRSENPNFGAPSIGTFSGISRRFQNTHNATLATEFYPNTKNTFGLSLTYTYLQSHNLVDINNAWDIQDKEYVAMKALSDGQNLRQNLNSALYFRKKWNEKTQLNLDASYLTYHNDSPTLINTNYFDRQGQEFDPQNSIFTYGNRGESVSKIQVGVLKADFNRQINEKITADFGIKGSYAYNNNDSKVERKVDDQWQLDPRSQSTIYSQERIGAGYAQFKFMFNPSSNLQAGLRYEYWQRDINVYEDAFVIAGLFPSVLYTQTLNEKSRLSLNYNRRISRPAYADLVSNLFYNDPTFVFSGNPLLKPTLTDVFKIDFSSNGYALGLSLQNDINPILRYQITTNAQQDIGISSPQNLDYQKSINLFATVPIQFFDWWKMSVSSNTSLRKYGFSYALSPAEKTFVFQSLNYSQNIRLPKGFEIELSGWHNFAFYEGSNHVKGFGVTNLGIAKKLKNEGGTLQLSLPDLFRSFSVHTQIGVVTPIAFNIRSVSNWRDESSLYRVIKLTYSRSFGKNTRSIQAKSAEEELDRVK